ncbi:MAG: hypothetical protein P1R58_02975 [bacterium]|nr:hypothetical protein [bacterium]
MWSPDGASIDISQSVWNPVIDWSQFWDGGIFATYFHGLTADTIGFGAFKIFTAGYPTGLSDISFIVKMEISCNDVGKTVCLDSTWYPPGANWLWSTTGGAVVPGWDGPHCWTIDRIPCLRPEWTSYPTETIDFDYCDTASMLFEADDPMGGSLIYRLLSGPGEIDSLTGVWTYVPQTDDV